MPGKTPQIRNTPEPCRGRAHEYELADTTVALEIAEGPRKGETVTLRQVTRREPASRRRPSGRCTS